MNNYNKLKLIGKGSYGTVYKAEKKITHEIYAIKQISAQKLKDKYEIKNLINELKILSFHNCEYLLKCRDIFYENHQINIVTDFAKFSDLSNYINKCKNKNKYIPEKTIWLIFIQCCYGLEYLHEYNIIHRDIKPANILLDSNSTILLADFGISKIIKNKVSSFTLIGTPYYISPEMYKDINYDKKIDIWSLGCILYELVTLNVPFQANDIKGLKKKIISGFYYDKIPNYYSKEISQIIHLLLDKNLNTRPSIQQILKLKIFKKKEHELKLYNKNNFNLNINEKLHNEYTLPKITSKWNLIINDIDKLNINKSSELPEPFYPPFEKQEQPIVEKKLPLIEKKNFIQNFKNNYPKLPKINVDVKNYKQKYTPNFYKQYNVDYYKQKYTPNYYNQYNADYYKHKYKSNYNIINNSRLY